ncbi:MAG: hypothetical protein H6727_17455, partial [Myxococcales bacterium]|nr:hypothetical protein [Myxococcales bacterium]
MKSQRWHVWIVMLCGWIVLSSGLACTTPTDPPNTNPPNTKPPLTQGQTIERHWTHRMIAGISMGGGFAAMVGLRNHEKFDIIGTLGGPNDHTYLLHFIQGMLTNGFCDPAKIAQFDAEGKLNEVSSYCNQDLPKPRFPFEIVADFNNWYYDDAGGNWNRNSLLRVVQDLLFALGNPGYYNPEGTYFPPGIPNDRRKQEDRCNNPIRIKNFRHHLYNPDGKYDAITFCDGTSERSGVYRPDKPEDHTAPAEIMLALDINGNGKRDYGEPIIFTPHEPYEDVGVDGCADDREDGKGGCAPEGQKGVGGADPNGDNYHPIDNPKGTEGNMTHDEGEPFKDNGLDGIPGTKDFGEDDKKFTVTPGLENFMAHDPHTLIRNMKPEELARMNIYIDGGIRDLFNFHVTGLNLLGAIRAKVDDPKKANLYERFVSLMPDGKSTFDAQKVDWSDKGQHVYIRYGDPNATPEQIDAGDGDHIHGAAGMINRVLAFFSYVTHQVPDPDLKRAEFDKEKKEGDVQHFFYDSQALGRQNIYSVVLPPGFHANPTARYPVIYFGHGYGMDGPGMASLLAVAAGLMKEGQLTKMIGVSVHGSCERIFPDPENPKRLRSEKAEECHKGTFYVDNKGFTGTDGPKMETAFFEVVK